MDPTMYTAIVANQVAEYLDELERERDAQRRQRSRPSGDRASWLRRLARLPIIRRHQPLPRCEVTTTTDAC